MTSYERMCRLIKSIGIYRLDGNSNVEKELICYGKFFDQLDKRLDNLMRDRFLETASYFFMEKYRGLFGMSRDLSTSKLREVLTLREKISDNDFTEEGILKCLKAGGIKATLTKTPDTNQVTVSVLADDNVFGSVTESNKYILSCMPCSLKATVSR